jgi:hypothetical protein
MPGRWWFIEPARSTLARPEAVVAAISDWRALQRAHGTPEAEQGSGARDGVRARRGDTLVGSGQAGDCSSAASSSSLSVQPAAPTFSRRCSALVAPGMATIRSSLDSSLLSATWATVLCRPRAMPVSALSSAEPSGRFRPPESGRYAMSATSSSRQASRTPFPPLGPEKAPRRRYAGAVPRIDRSVGHPNRCGGAVTHRTPQARPQRTPPGISGTCRLVYPARGRLRPSTDNPALPGNAV